MGAILHWAPVLLASLYIWNAFTLMLRLRALPELIGAPRHASLLGFELPAAAAILYCTGGASMGVCVALFLAGVFCSGLAARVEIDLLRSWDRFARRVTVGGPLPRSDAAGGNAGPDNEVEVCELERSAALPPLPEGSVPEGWIIGIPGVWRAALGSVFWASGFAAWQFEGLGGGWRSWVSLTVLALAPWAFHRMLHPTPGWLPSVISFLSMPTAAVMVIWAVLSR